MYTFRDRSKAVGRFLPRDVTIGEADDKDRCRLALPAQAAIEGCAAGIAYRVELTEPATRDLEDNIDEAERAVRTIHVRHGRRDAFTLQGEEVGVAGAPLGAV